MDAMSNPAVHEAYRKKVSPERAGPEILKMFGAERPAEAIRALFATGMDKAVFDAPEVQGLHPLTMDQKNRHHKFNLLEHTLRVVENLDRIMKQKKVDKNDRILMLMAAVFHDYGKAHPEIGKEKPNDPGEFGYAGHEDKSADIADAILKRIGIGEDDRKFVQMVVKQHMRPHTDSWSNKSMGKFMRDTQIPGSNREDVWQFVMMHAQADTMAKSEEGDQADYDLKEEHIRQMNEYRNRPVPIQMKPLVDGMMLQKMFPGLSLKPPKGQPNFIKYIQDKLMDEQLAGNIADQAQAVQFVESIRGEVQTMYGNPQGKQANNWYGKAKQADASSGSSFGTGGRLISEGPEPQWEGVKTMIYRSPGEASMVSVGDIYRSKGVGVAFQSGKDRTYKVVEKSGTHVMLQYDKDKKLKVEIGTELPAKFVKV
jgi:CRISPR/Cas system-associated endonuclease Cas3-HD